MRIYPLVLASLLISGCSTQRELLELRRDRLLAIEANAVQVRDAIPQGSFEPERYDAYFALEADVFQRVFSEIEGTSVELDARGRTVTININEFATNFRAGSPEITLSANAVDQSSGVEAGVEIDTRLLISEDPENAGDFLVSVEATRIVPDLRWGPFNFTRARFVRALLALEISKLTDQLPEVRLPLRKDFAFGSPASTFNSGRLNTGNGSWISGNISLPDTRYSGTFAVENILFLENGVHIFASVEGAAE